MPEFEQPKRTDPSGRFDFVKKTIPETEKKQVEKTKNFWEQYKNTLGIITATIAGFILITKFLGDYVETKAEIHEKEQDEKILALQTELARVKKDLNDSDSTNARQSRIRQDFDLQIVNVLKDLKK